MITFTSSVVSMLMSVAMSAAAQDLTPIAEPPPVRPDAQIAAGAAAALTVGAPGTRITTVCPADAIFSQPAMDSGTAGNSDVQGGFKIFDNYSTYQPIEGLRFWGISAHYDGAWSQCTPSDPETFLIEFWADDGTGTPNLTMPVCSLSVSTSPIADGSWGSWDAYMYELDLYPNSCPQLDGWISIQGNSDNSCWFLWINAAFNDGAWQGDANGDDMTATDYDFGFCLTASFWTVPTGACCHAGTGLYEDQVPMGLCTGERFVADTLCIDLDPPCGEATGACCQPDGTCTITLYVDCLDADWLGMNTTCDECRPYGGCCLGHVCAPTSPMAEEDCLAIGGYYLGDGVACTYDLCDCGGTDYRGDANCLGDGPNSYDIDAFILAIGNPAEWIATYGCDYYCANDTNCDGAVNAYDIDSFVWCVSQGQCDPCP